MSNLRAPIGFLGSDASIGADQPFSGTLERVLEKYSYNFHDAGYRFAEEWTKTETHGTVTVVDGALEIEWLNAGDPDTVAYAQLTHAALTTAPDYRRYRFSVTVDAGFSISDGELHYLAYLKSAASSTANITIQRSGAQYRLQTYDFSSGDIEASGYGDFVFGSTYYCEWRAYPDAANGGTRLLVYSDASYSTPVASLTLTPNMTGLDAARLPSKLELGSSTSDTTDAAGTITYGPVSIEDVYEDVRAQITNNQIQLTGVNW